MQSISIESAELQATISSLGAELAVLRDPDGFDYLWNGDPAWWPSHAPILFPIVGEVRGNALKVDGKLYPIGRHGFARGSTFEVVRSERTRCSFQPVRQRSNESALSLRFFARRSLRSCWASIARAGRSNEPRKGRDARVPRLPSWIQVAVGSECAKGYLHHLFRET